MLTISYDCLSPSDFSFVSSLDFVSIPKTKTEAMVDLGRHPVMVEEMAALHSSGTWKLVPLPLSNKIVRCHWIYTVKIGPDGHVDQLKA